MKKGLDATFVHYGIRRDDLNLIETLCGQHNLDFDWVKEELLKRFHEGRIQEPERFDDKAVDKIIEKALQKIK